MDFFGNVVGLVGQSGQLVGLEFGGFGFLYSAEDSLMAAAGSKNGKRCASSVEENKMSKMLKTER